MKISSTLNSTPPTSKDGNVRRSFNFKNLFSAKSTTSSKHQQTPPSLTKSPTSLLQRTASTIKFRKDNSSISPPKLSTLDEDDDRFDAISQASTGKLVMRKGEQRPWRNFFTRSFISSTDSNKKEDEENEEHYENHRAALQSPRIAHRRRVSVIGDVECDRKIFANKYAAFAPSPADCRKLDLLVEKQFHANNPRSKAPSDSIFTSDDDNDGGEEEDEIAEYQSDNRLLNTPKRRRQVHRMKSSRTLPRLNIYGEGNGALLASPSVPDYSTRAFTTPRKLRGGVQKRWKRREQIQRRKSVNQTYIESAVLESSSSQRNNQQQNFLHRNGASAIELPRLDNNGVKKIIPKRLYSVAAGGDGQFKYEKDKKNSNNIFGSILSMRTRGKKTKENRSLGNIYPGYNNSSSTTNPSPSQVYPYKADVLA
uniref:Uncharacterized protein n=1 Tax=Panagrolaimus superbus TaxID=310955 RepID=A0A914YZ23_9BILA